MKRIFVSLAIATAAARLTLACGDDAATTNDAASTDPDASGDDAAPAPDASADALGPLAPCADRRALKNPYFGDLHAHTAYSLDAYSFGTRNTPIDAYAFARGKTLALAEGTPEGGTTHATIERPLDFLALTDHSEWLGAAVGCGVDRAGAPFDPSMQAFDAGACTTVRAIDPGVQSDVFAHMTGLTSSLCDGGRCPLVEQSAWAGEQTAAAAANVPCTFTSFVGYEWTLGIAGATLHKNVVFATDKVPAAPLDSLSYPTQAALWNGLEAQCTSDAGCEALTIPHNSNLSQGGAFVVPPDLAALSAKYQRLVEIFQHKGGSECFYDKSPGAGPQDPDCNFEYAGGVTEPNDRASYVQSGLSKGLERGATGPNPFMMGFVGGTDDHNGTPGNTREDTWPGHVGRHDDTPAKRVAPPPAGGLGTRVSHNPGGLTVAWAEENSRAALFAAFRRRETYATSGTRMVVRFFQTWGTGADACTDPDFPAVLVAGGAVPMGGTFGGGPPGAGGPRFVVQAWKDRTDLASIDIIKLWIDGSGAPQRSIVRDVVPAGSGGGRCFVWQDPSFVAGPTLYYARVLENPTPRWSAVDCTKASASAPTVCAKGGALDTTIQERAWTSPIWYAP